MADMISAKEWFDKGVGLFENNKFEEAIQAYDEAIKIDPALAEAWTNKGNALIVLGKYEDALKTYEEVK
jgi:tetratricopeptide (TPR) repeat protein